MDNYSTPKKMKLVGDLFDRYKTLFKAPQATVEKACAEAILKLTGYPVSEDNIKYTVSTKTISLQVPSVLKSELKFKYSEILEELRKKLGERDSPQTII